MESESASVEEQGLRLGIPAAIIIVATTVGWIFFKVAAEEAFHEAVWEHVRLIVALGCILLAMAAGLKGIGYWVKRDSTSPAWMRRAFKMGAASSFNASGILLLFALLLSWFPPDDPTNDEHPLHTVTLTKGIYVSAHEVTCEQFDAVMGTKHRFNNAVKGAAVTGVSWFDAVMFCNELSRREGLTPCYQVEHDAPPGRPVRKALVEHQDGDGYRLPTEAEWEYVCRAGTRTVWWFGDDPAAFGKHGWISENSDQFVHPVGELAPNPFGLYDVYGNVWEWCHDWYGANYYANSPAVDPMGPPAGRGRVLRGGSVVQDARNARSAVRYGLNPGALNNVIGFRVVRLLANPPEQRRMANDVGITLIFIDPGTFEMGSP